MYNAMKGDTIQSVAARFRITTNELVNANPSLRLRPLQAGDRLVTPIQDPLVQAGSTASDDTIAIRVKGKLLTGFDSFSITSSFDGIAKATFIMPYKNAGLKPFGFEQIQVSIGQDKVFTGTVIGFSSVDSLEGNSVKIEAYALPGILEDCSSPSGPNVFRNKNALEIALRLCQPFGIQVDVIPGLTLPRIHKIIYKPERRVYDFLVEVAQKSGVLLNSTVSGKLLITTLQDNIKITNKMGPGSPIISITPEFNTKDYYSHIIGIIPIRGFNPYSKATARVKIVNNKDMEIYRPFVYRADNLTDLKHANARMNGNAISYTVEMATWFDIAGLVWTPGDLINIEYPEAYITKPFNLLIRSATLKNDGSATLKLCLPKAFGGADEGMPWD